jgi:hypothetical protein
MNKNNNISSILPKHLFWDMDVNTLSFEEDKDIIIPRALFSTTEESFDKEISTLEGLYSKDEIISTLKNTKERISNKVCLMVSNKYSIEPFYRYKV